MEHTRILPGAPGDAEPSAALSDQSAPGRHDGWTPAKQAEFLRQLAATQSVSAAARSVGMTRQTAYRLRARLKNEPFDIAWHYALRRQYDALMDAVVERAIHGVEVPHFHKGELIHTSRRFDDRAAVALRRGGARQHEGADVRGDEPGQLAPPLQSWRAEAARVDIEDFECLLGRIEWGDEMRAPIAYADDELEDGAD